MIDAKQIKKLAAACRKSGIKEFTSPEFSFKLTDEAPITHTSKAHKSMIPMTLDTSIESDTPSAMDLLFWSASGQEDLLKET